jgi:type II secretory pathway component PulF
MSSVFEYVALTPAGERVRGAIDADTAALAHVQLERRGLMALRIARARRQSSGGTARYSMTSARLADFAHSLGVLALSGVDLRTALGVLGRAERGRSAGAKLALDLQREISAGMSAEAAILKVLGRRGEAVAAFVAAGEASGDLGGALSRCADAMEEEGRAAEQLAAALAYPTFVLVMTAVSLGAILLFVVPTLEPLLDQTNGPAALNLLFATSDTLRENGAAIFCAIGAVSGLGWLGWRWGFLRRPVESWLLDGPFRTTVSALAFGRAVALLGLIVASRAPTVQAFQTAGRSLRLSVARERLQRSADAVRDGASVSHALEACRGMPGAIVRLASVGEEVGALGPMLERGGRLEARKALRRVEQATRWLGPALIVALGAIIGTIMASLLTSITALGNVATAT